MTGRERMHLAMQHRAADRVPVMCQLALGHYFLHAGIPPRLIWFTSEGFARALVTLQRRYAFDGILINLPGRPPALGDDIAAVEPLAGGAERLVWKSGARTVVPPDDSPQHFLAGDAPLPRASWGDLDPALEAIHDVPGYVWNIYHVPQLAEVGPGILERVPAYFRRTYDLVRAAVGDEVSVHCEVFSPFTHFMELLGYEEGLMALITDPARCHAVLERLLVAAAVLGTAEVDWGADAVLISSAFAGGGFISREMYREFVLPYERRLAADIQRRGTPVYTHTCGRIGDRLDLLAATGIDGIDTLDPRPLGDADLAEAKRAIGDRLFIKGNLDSVALLRCTSREEVIAAVDERLRIGRPGGGYILSTACSVAPRVEPWQLELLAPRCDAVGRYS